MSTRKKTKSRKSLAKTILVNLALFCGVMLVCFLLFELALRLTINDPAPDKKYHPVYVYTYSPGMTETFFSEDLNKTLTHTYSSQGWFGPEEEYRLTTNKSRRVLIIGDSYASQINLERSGDVFGELLRARLNATTDVLTIAVSSYAFDNEAKILEIEGKDYRPDVVVFATFMNDIMDTYRDNVFSLVDGTLVDNTPRKIPFARKAIYFCASRSYACGFALNVAATRGDLLNRVAARLGLSDIKRDTSVTYTIYGIADDLFMNKSTLPQAVDVSWRKVDLILQRVKAYERENNATVVFLLIPLREQVSERKRAEFFATHPTLDPATFDFSKPYRDVRRLIEANGFAAIDLETPMRAQNTDNEFYYELDGHWTQAGHKLAADEIYTYLNRHGLIGINGEEQVAAR